MAGVAIALQRVRLVNVVGRLGKLTVNLLKGMIL